MERQYKNSGIPWMEQIPTDWDIIRGKNLLYLMNRPVREDDDVVTCFRDGEVILRSERRTEGFTMSDKEFGYQGINRGDIVIHGMDGFAGSMGVSKSTGKGSPVLIVCNPKTDDDARYIIYYLRSLAMNDVFIALSTGIRERSCDLRWNKISVLPFVRPSFSEQKRIADFIDEKCGDIDSLIGLQEKIIEKLKAYKISIITEVVTKGLNPNVKLVSSDIEWIDEIPKDWKTIRIKNLLKERKERSESGLEEPLSMSQKHGLIPTKEMDVIPNMASSFVGAKIVYTSDLVFNKLKAHLGVFSVSKYYGLVSPDYAVYYSTGRADLKYLEYLFKSPKCIGEFKLYTNDLYSILIPFPSLSEQQSIASYLDDKCSEIDNLVAIKQQKIEKLKDYKKSIIYEAVTGKIIIES